MKRWRILATARWTFYMSMAATATRMSRTTSVLAAETLGSRGRAAPRHQCARAGLWSLAILGRPAGAIPLLRIRARLRARRGSGRTLGGGAPAAAVRQHRAGQGGDRAD